jgi:hypothetical protein
MRRLIWPVSKARRKAGQSKRRAALPGEHFFSFAETDDENPQWNQLVLVYFRAFFARSFCVTHYTNETE